MTSPPNYLIPIWDTIKMAWSKIKGSKASICIGYILILVLGFCIGFLSGLFLLITPILGGLVVLIGQIISFLLLGGLVVLIGQIISFLLLMGLMYMGIKHAADKPISVRDMFYPLINGKVTLKIIGVYLLTLVCLLPFIILAFVPGPLFEEYGNNQSPLAQLILAICYIIAMIGTLFITVRFFLGIAFVLDQNKGPWEAIKSSFNATRGNAWRLIGIMILQLIIFAISIIPFFLGLIWTIPFVFVLYGVMYKRLTQHI